jgi:hypothetical protein
MEKTTRAMAMATKRAMATSGNTAGNGYHCPLSSAVAVAAVGKDDKGRGGLFLYGVMAHLGKNMLHIYWNFIFPPINYCFSCWACNK